MLQSEGGLQRQRCRIINFKDEPGRIGPKMDSWYLLSQDQSERLLEASPWESIDGQEARFAKMEAFVRAAKEIVADLTEADLVTIRISYSRIHMNPERHKHS
jgi:hypothetical protein